MNKYIVDVREPEEYASGHVEGALNIPLSELMRKSAKLDNLPKNAEVIVYCNSGNRSGVSKNIIESMGYTNVTNGINKDLVEAISKRS